VQDVEGETLIYDLEKNKALCLNHTSALVWQACDGKRTITEINDLLGKQLQAQTDEDIVWLALDQLSKENLIDPTTDLESRLEGMSRREIIKKIGLGSMVTLPVVASLIAPAPSFAQTCSPPLDLPDGSPCTQSCQCTIGCCCSFGAPAPLCTSPIVCLSSLLGTCV
jgi:hypothetical protein